MGNTYIVNGERVGRDDYNKIKYDRFLLTVPQGKKEVIMKYAESQGKSLNGYIVDLIRADMEKAGHSLE